MALLCVRLFSKESEKIEKYVDGLPDMFHGSVMASELIDKKISTLAECQAENKRKLDNNNEAQQQSPKRQNVAQAYTAGTCKKKEYAGILPLCNRNPAADRNQRTLTCYEYGNPGHYRSDCPELKNQNHGNEAEGTRARGLVHTLGGGGEADQDLNDMEDNINWSTETRESQTRRCRRYDQEGYIEGEVRDRVMLKISPWKGVARFGKRGKLNPRYVGPSKVLEKVGTIPYKLEMPQELSRVLHTFHVSNLKKCYTDELLAVPLDGLHIEDKLHFIKEPAEILDREVKRLKQSRILIVEV
ncbi:putative reverse transcriptase domain-containing protein [Tanacetum coccineum]